MAVELEVGIALAVKVVEIQCVLQQGFDLDVGEALRQLPAIVAIIAQQHMALAAAFVELGADVVDAQLFGI